MNIKVKKDSVVEFKPVNLKLEKSELNDLLKNDYGKADKENGLIPIYNRNNGEVLGFLDENDNFQFWTVTNAIKFRQKTNNIAGTITHESAHMIQFLKDKNLTSWYNALQRNNLNPQKSSLTEYGKTTYEEMFAETYTAFVYDNNGLKSQNPNLYNTFVKYLEEIGVDINTIQIAK